MSLSELFVKIKKTSSQHIIFTIHLSIFLFDMLYHPKIKFNEKYPVWTNFFFKCRH